MISPPLDVYAQTSTKINKDGDFIEKRKIRTKERKIDEYTEIEITGLIGMICGKNLEKRKGEQLFMFSNYIAVDIGTENIRVASGESGRVICEPTVVAVSADDGEVCAVGQEAKELMERVPGRYNGLSPVKDGMIADFNMLQLLLSELIKKHKKGFRLIQPKAVAAVHAGLTAMNKRELEDAIKTSGVRDVLFIDAPIAGCIGMGEDVSEATARMVLSMGAGFSEIAVICMGRSVSYKMVPIGGRKFDEVIAQMIRREMDLWIGECVTESLKKRIGLKDPKETLTLCGKNIVSGLPMMASIGSGEIVKTLIRPAMELVEAMREMLYHLPEELLKDIHRTGVLMIGGGSRMAGLSELIEKELNIKTRMSAYPENVVINGVLQVAMELGGWRKAETEEEQQNLNY